MSWNRWVERSLLGFDCFGRRYSFVLVQFFDRSFGVLCNGQLLAEYRWPEGQADEAFDGFVDLWNINTGHHGAHCARCADRVRHSLDTPSPPLSAGFLECWSQHRAGMARHGAIHYTHPPALSSDEGDPLE